MDDLYLLCFGHFSVFHDACCELVETGVVSSSQMVMSTESLVLWNWKFVTEAGIRICHAFKHVVDTDC